MGEKCPRAGSIVSGQVIPSSRLSVLHGMILELSLPMANRSGTEYATRSTCGSSVGFKFRGVQRSP